MLSPADMPQAFWPRVGTTSTWPTVGGIPSISWRAEVAAQRLFTVACRFMLPPLAPRRANSVLEHLSVFSRVLALLMACDWAGAYVSTGELRFLAESAWQLLLHPLLHSGQVAERTVCRSRSIGAPSFSRGLPTQGRYPWERAKGGSLSNVRFSSSRPLPLLRGR